MLSYLKILRPLNCIMAAFAVYMGTVVGGSGLYVNILTIYGMTAVFLISGAGMVINDYFDFEIDKLNRPGRSLPSGKIKKNTALAYSVLLFIIGIYLGYMTNIYCFYVAFAASALLVAYAKYLKKVMFIKNVTVSTLVALTFVFGGLIIGNYIHVLSLALLAFLSNTGREVYRDIEDVMGDKQHGAATLPVKLGLFKARIIANLFIFLSIAFSFVPFFLNIMGYVYMFFVIIADMIFIFAVITPTKYSAKLCKLAMVVALLAFLAGTVKF